MDLKNARLARAENLSNDIRNQIGISIGLVIIETKNPNLRDEYRPIREGGIREYLLSLGKFNDIDIEG